MMLVPRLAAAQPQPRRILPPLSVLLLMLVLGSIAVMRSKSLPQPIRGTLLAIVLLGSSGSLWSLFRSPEGTHLMSKADDLKRHVFTVLLSLFHRLHQAKQLVGSTAAAQVRDLQDFAATRVSGAVDRQVNKVIRSAMRGIQNYVIDPDMPIALKQLIQETLSRTVPDIQREVVRKAREMITSPMRGPLGHSHQLPPPPPMPTTMHNPSVLQEADELEADPEPLVNCLLRHAVVVYGQFRAFVLYNLAPADKSMWANLRNPLYWLLWGVGLIPIPILSYAWWMLLFFMKTRSDEYQLVDFIIGFEMSKFFSNGCWGLLQGAARYFACTSFPVHFPCVYYAPQASLLDMFVFVWQMGLVQWAYQQLWHMPEMGTPATPDLQFESPATSAQTPATISLHSPFPRGRRRSLHHVPHEPPTHLLRRGGALQNLFHYQVCVSSLCCALLLFFAGCDVFAPTFGYNVNDMVADGAVHSVFPAAVYWVRTCYGLLALPYLAFKLPLVTKLYVTKRSTGYLRDGSLSVCFSPQKEATT